MKAFLPPKNKTKQNKTRIREGFFPGLVLLLCFLGKGRVGREIVVLGMAGDEMGGSGKDRKFVGKKAKQRLGGKCLSLDAFVRARSVFNPCEIRKKREFYENAKKVKTYKKLVKQIGDHKMSTEYDLRASELKDLQEYQCMWQNTPQGSREGMEKLNHVAGDTFDGSQSYLNCSSGVPRKHKKGLNYLERLRKEYQKKHEEEQKKREDRQKAIAEKQEAQLKALQVRKNFQVKMLKKTRSGQPVMKHRLEHILESLQQQQQQ